MSFWPSLLFVHNIGNYKSVNVAGNFLGKWSFVSYRINRFRVVSMVLELNMRN